MSSQNFNLSKSRRKAQLALHRLNRVLSRTVKNLFNGNVRVYKQNEEYDSHLIDDLPLTFIRSGRS